MTDFERPSSEPEQLYLADAWLTDAREYIAESRLGPTRAAHRDLACLSEMVDLSICCPPFATALASFQNERNNQDSMHGLCDLGFQVEYALENFEELKQLIEGTYPGQFVGI